MADRLTPQSRPTADPKQLVHGLAASWNARKVDELCWGLDAEFISPFGDIRGREGIIEFVRGFWEAIPDARLEIDRSLGEGALVAAEGTMKGTHDGPLRVPGGEVAPTGRRIELRWGALYETRGEEVISEHLYFDRFDLMTQLGLIPAPDSTEEE